MTMEPDNVRAWLTGEVYVAAKGTAMPTDISASLNSSFKSLGVLAQEDGLTETPSESKTDVFGWGVDLVRTLNNQFKVVMKVVALETNPVVIGLLNPQHGATVAGGVTTYSRKSPTHVPVAMVVEMTDGPITTRLCAKAADATSTDEVPYGQTGVAKRGITFDLYADSNGSFFDTITNDPAMVYLSV